MLIHMLKLTYVNLQEQVNITFRKKQAFILEDLRAGFILALCLLCLLSSSNFYLLDEPSPPFYLQNGEVSPKAEANNKGP
jgi:hypothetical protein